MPNTHQGLKGIACLLGAARVAAAAAAAHGGAELLAPAAQLLLANAAAGLAMSAVLGRSPIGRLAIACMEAGSLLFAADMAMRSLRGEALFPMAAPGGGTLVIMGWLAAAMAGATIRSGPEGR
jgi:uncharacterized membrane protein YgdD (TMEM256/DUF423 family)